MCAKKYYTDFQSLLKGISDSFEHSLSTTVASNIKNKISVSAKQTVIKDTSGRSTGGIDDVSMMKSRIEKKGKTLTLIVTDTAKPSPSVFGQSFDTVKDAKVNGTMFANWIEHGEWVDLRQLLQYRMGQQWAWNPREESWASKYNPRLASMEGAQGAMAKARRDYKPRREPRPFMGPVQEQINANPQDIIDCLLNGM